MPGECRLPVGRVRGISRATQMEPPARAMCSVDGIGLKRYVHQGVTAGRGLFHRQRNPAKVQTHNPPLRVTEHHDRYFPALQILLVPDTFVGGEQNVEPRGLRRFQQVAIRHSIPPAISGLYDLVARERLGNAAWGAMVKENAHPSKSMRQREPAVRRGCGRRIRVPPESALASHETVR